MLNPKTEHNFWTFSQKLAGREIRQFSPENWEFSDFNSPNFAKLRRAKVPGQDFVDF
jgi:hypothetical protein